MKRNYFVSWYYSDGHGDIVFGNDKAVTDRETVTFYDINVWAEAIKNTHHLNDRPVIIFFTEIFG